ncbi:TPA: hypothetical protein L3H01_003446 [Serratia marcescens]|nr:hypothetical protein [Serratia marcescens]
MIDSLEKLTCQQTDRRADPHTDRASHCTRCRPSSCCSTCAGGNTGCRSCGCCATSSGGRPCCSGTGSGSSSCGTRSTGPCC